MQASSRSSRPSTQNVSKDSLRSLWRRLTASRELIPTLHTKHRAGTQLHASTRPWRLQPVLPRQHSRQGVRRRHQQAALRVARAEWRSKPPICRGSRARCSARLSSGKRQGDPLMPGLFAVGMPRRLSALDCGSDQSFSRPPRWGWYNRPGTVVMHA